MRCLPYVQLILKYRYLKEIIKVIQLTTILRIKIEKKFGITDTIVKVLRKSCHIPIKLKSVLNATFKIRILIYEMPILMFEFIVNHYCWKLATSPSTVYHLYYKLQQLSHISIYLLLKFTFIYRKTLQPFLILIIKIIKCSLIYIFKILIYYKLC